MSDTITDARADAERELEQIVAHGNRFHYRSGPPYERGRNWFRCADGAFFSAVAGWGTYCQPRPGWPEEWGGVADDYSGPFEDVEVWFHDVEDPEQTSVADLRAYIAEHGGLAEVAPVGDHPAEWPASAPARYEPTAETPPVEDATS